MVTINELKKTIVRYMAENDRLTADIQRKDVLLKELRKMIGLIRLKHIDIKNHNIYPHTTPICNEAISAIDAELGKVGGVNGI